MGRHSGTILKINRPKSDTDKKRRKKIRRWGIKSCLSLLLAATVTTTTIYSQVLYAQAETGEAPDNRTAFTFQPLEKTEYELDTKGTQEETLEKLHEMGLPETLTVTTQPEAVVTDLVNPDVPGNIPDADVTDTDAAENILDADVMDTDSTENTEGSGIKDPENTSGSDAEDTDSAENTDGSNVKDPENTSGSGAGDSDSSQNTDGPNAKDWGDTMDFDAADTDSSKDSITVLSVTVPDTPVNSATEEAPVEIVTLENDADSDVTNNTPGTMWTRMSRPVLSLLNFP